MTHEELNQAFDIIDTINDLYSLPVETMFDFFSCLFSSCGISCATVADVFELPQTQVSRGTAIKYLLIQYIGVHDLNTYLRYMHLL